MAFPSVTPLRDAIRFVRFPGGAIAALFCCVLAIGCQSHDLDQFDPSLSTYNSLVQQIEYPDACVSTNDDVATTLAPRTVESEDEIEYWPLTLEEAVHMALAKSRVMRDLGARILTTPQAARSIYDPAIQQTNPRTGPEAALSAFDAQFTTGILWNHNERTFNNLLVGGGATDIAQTTANFQMDITKRTAAGTQYSLRNIVLYDRNTAPLNTFNSAYDTLIEAEFRHPLLQGSGIEFNRIAGPYARPGQYNGVLIARTNTDVSLAEFEIAVRDLIHDVERNYWELYFAYRDLDAKVAGRNAALQTWRSLEKKYRAGTADNEQEARAREQYYFFQAQVLNSLNGTNLGSSLIDRRNGVLAIERRLRALMGLTASDGRIIRPANEPSKVEVSLRWDELLQDALWRRAELRRQKWVIKRRELELQASKSFLKMKLDLVGQYRWRGFGDDLFGDTNVDNGSAFEDLFTGDLQEWQFGVQLATPVGNRIGHLAVRNAELQVTRERAILEEQELAVTHELSDAYAELKRAFAVAKTGFNQRLAALEQLNATRKKYEAGRVPLEFLLDAQRRAVEAENFYYRGLVDYNLAIADIYLARGRLLSYHGVQLNEGPWSERAHRSAAKQSRHFTDRHMNYVIAPCPISLGPMSDDAFIESEGEIIYSEIEPIPVQGGSSDPLSTGEPDGKLINPLEIMRDSAPPRRLPMDTNPLQLHNEPAPPSVPLESKVPDLPVPQIRSAGFVAPEGEEAIRRLPATAD